jgi:propanediol dehydratase small subunit
MLWLKAKSVVELGIITATLKGSAAAGASAAAGSSAGAADPPQADKINASVKTETNNKLFFIFISLKNV